MIDIEQNRKRIGAEITSIRESLKMTQKDMAGRAGIRPNHVYRLEKGMYSVGLDVLSKVLDSLGCEIKIVKK
jgi:transcriptional regulator with XRE-family HTH domain